jgi:signal transduction histidine kinase
LLNLLLNAAQVSPAGGTIEVRCRKLNRRGTPFLAIAVEDRGPGLPAEIRRRVFTPFFTTRNGGTGLGLLSSRRMASQMGGELGLYPRGSGGARALLLLPAAPAGQASSPRALAGALA